MVVSKISLTIFRTVPNCPVYTPMVKRLKPNNSKREPTTLCSDESMVQSLFGGLMIGHLIIQRPFLLSITAFYGVREVFACVTPYTGGGAHRQRHG